jgi:AraC family transcriptional regulator
MESAGGGHHCSHPDGYYCSTFLVPIKHEEDSSFLRRLNYFKMKTFETQELVIKNMICSRCLKVIRQDLESLGVEVLDLRLGRLKFRYPTDGMSLSKIEAVLEDDEFEIVKDKNEALAEEVKMVLIGLVSDLPILRDKKLSDYLADNLHKDYWTLSKLFSKTEGTTIERYFILLRVEKAKELIEYDEMNFSEIAYELGYHNIYHLSGQFKQVTGMSMSQYKKMESKLRSPLNKIM